MGNTKKRIKNCKKNAKKGAAALPDNKRLLESAYGDTSWKRMRERKGKENIEDPLLARALRIDLSR